MGADRDAVVNWLHDWFARRGPLPDLPRAEWLDLDFFEAGLVDSFGIMELITAIEQQFGVAFQAEHFERKSFFKLNGLADLIVQIQRGAV